MIRRLILHAGTPKTGTTSLQIALEADRTRLAQAGVHYPATLATPYPRLSGEDGVKPKHQWLVGHLREPDAAPLSDWIAGALATAPPDAHTAIVSTEGLYHHWWDFSDAGRAGLQSLTERMHVELWVWLRQPRQFLVSNYIQMLKNPRSEVACYGRDWSLERMLDDAWFVRRLDYAGFLQSVDALLPGAVRPFVYQPGGTVRQFYSALDLAPRSQVEPCEHRTLGAAAVEALRALNRLDLSASAKQARLNEVTRQDADLGAAWRPFEPPTSIWRRLEALSGAGLEALRRVHGIDFSPAHATSG